jgi:hypothetical protein
MMAKNVIRMAANLITKSNFITCTKLGSHGRIGNQMFQIAAIIGLAKSRNIKAKFPKWYCNYEHIYFSDYFKNKIDETLDISLIKHRYKEPKFEYGLIPKYTEPVDLLGYFQSEKYFQNCISEIRNYFEPKDSLINKINDKYKNELSGLTCSIHIRRGDYVGSRVHDVCNINYYNKCITHMKNLKVDKFLILSDDIQWCKENFIGNEFIFIEGNSTIEDLFIMSLCTHNIIANSSFSWWGSWLNKNPNKIVCAPSKWFADSSSIKQYESIYRKDMIKFN